MSQDIDLSAFDDDFSSLEAPCFEKVPDGNYQVRIDSVRLAYSRNGNPMIRWDLIIIGGRYAGRHIFKNSTITLATLRLIKSELETVGLKLAKFSDLSNRLNELLDVTLEITKRTRGDYTNVYFNKRIEIAGNPQTLDDDEVPF